MNRRSPVVTAIEIAASIAAVALCAYAAAALAVAWFTHPIGAPR